MITIKMTAEQMRNFKLTPEMLAIERDALSREPDLTDPDAPEVSDESIAAWKALRPGRKNPLMKKVLTPIRLSADVAAALKSLGPHYTTKADAMLRKSLIGIGALPA